MAAENKRHFNFLIATFNLIIFIIHQFVRSFVRMLAECFSVAWMPLVLHRIFRGFVLDAVLVLTRSDNEGVVRQLWESHQSSAWAWMGVRLGGSTKRIAQGRLSSYPYWRQWPSGKFCCTPMRVYCCFRIPGENEKGQGFHWTNFTHRHHRDALHPNSFIRGKCRKVNFSNETSKPSWKCRTG